MSSSIVSRSRWTRLFIIAFSASLSLGCGSSGPPPREDIAAIPPEEHFSKSTKTAIYEFCAKVRKRGVKGAQQALPEVLEPLDGYENRPLGKHADVYKQIYDKLKSIESMVSGSTTDAAVKQAVEELDELTDQLPGEAVENPRVE